MCAHLKRNAFPTMALHDSNHLIGRVGQVLSARSVGWVMCELSELKPSLALEGLNIKRCTTAFTVANFD